MASNYIGILGVYQNTPNLAAQAAVYANVGFVVDFNAELADGDTVPDEWFTARGVKRENLKESIAMRLPSDPYMHIWFHSWHDIDTKPQWPPVFNGVGCPGFTLLVDDVQKELDRIRKDFPKVEVLQEPLSIKRKWGLTQTALLRDPEGVFLEITAVDGSPHTKAAKPVPPTEKGFLHFMINCEASTYPEVKKFYRAFGMEHDSGVDFREDGYPDGMDYFKNQCVEGFGSLPGWGECDFLRGTRDLSHMHLELLEAKEPLKLPSLERTWHQRGIARYCLKVPSFEEELRKVKQRGNKIYVEQQKACFKWGDSTWLFSGDNDNHILTLEQWFSDRHWGGR